MLPAKNSGPLEYATGSADIAHFGVICPFPAPGFAVLKDTVYKKLSRTIFPEFL